MPFSGVQSCNPLNRANKSPLRGGGGGCLACAAQPTAVEQITTALDLAEDLVTAVNSGGKHSEEGRNTPHAPSVLLKSPLKERKPAQHRGHARNHWSLHLGLSRNHWSVHLGLSRNHWSLHSGLSVSSQKQKLPDSWASLANQEHRFSANPIHTVAVNTDRLMHAPGPWEGGGGGGEHMVCTCTTHQHTQTHTQDENRKKCKQKQNKRELLRTRRAALDFFLCMIDLKGCASVPCPAPLAQARPRSQKSRQNSGSTLTPRSDKPVLAPQKTAVPKNPENSDSTPTLCLDKPVLAQGGRRVLTIIRWTGKRALPPKPQTLRTIHRGARVLPAVPGATPPTAHTHNENRENKTKARKAVKENSSGTAELS